MSPLQHIALTRICGPTRTKVEYTVDDFARAYALDDRPTTLKAARALAERLASQTALREARYSDRLPGIALR